MLKKFSFILLFLFIFPVYVHSDSIDFPYYMGLVIADGGTTINDGNWMQYSICGHERSLDPPPWSVSYESNGAQTVELLNNGAVAVLNWEDDGVATWLLQGAAIFRVNQNTLVYYGRYAFDEVPPQAKLLDNPQRFKRQWTTGESFNLTETIGANTDKTGITFERKGVTVSANKVPGSYAVADCALIHFYHSSESSSEYEYSTGIWAPGRGEVSSVSYKSKTNRINVKSKERVIYWGTSSAYQAYMIADLPAALVALDGLTLNDANIVDVKPTGGTKVIVIPMN